MARLIKQPTDLVLRLSLSARLLEAFRQALETIPGIQGIDDNLFTGQMIKMCIFFMITSYFVKIRTETVKCKRFR